MTQADPDPIAPPASLADSTFIGGGEMGKLVRAKDWSRTPLGPIDSWPPSLRTAVSLVLNSNFPMCLAWGPQHIQIYNDGYMPMIAGKHPGLLGEDFRVSWASVWSVVGADFERAWAGTTAFLEDSRMFLDRLGYLEESFFTFSFSPIRDETGRVAGLLHPLTETTGNMLAQRRTRILRDLTAVGLEAKTLDDALRGCAQVLAEAQFDLPFVLFYRIEEDRRTARLLAQAGLAPGGAASPAGVDLTREDAAWPLAKVGAGGTALAVDDLRERFPGLVCGPYPEPIAAARLLPVAPPGFERARGIMVVGVSTRLPLNEAYASFHELLGATVGNVVASALAAEAERRRAAALAEIDRAKIAFFANISHEFRTPLTLMLGPLEDELAERASPLPIPRRERIETAHRNSLRLLKLVNSLLDFSRIEAGRAQAAFQPTDLAANTAELACTFRSAVEKAGLSLTVDCPALPEPVWVDRDMWEKVVLNLLSNALKHTFTGGIKVALRWGGDHAELEVADSGSGIPAADLPHLFERFHRVQGASSRTHEGTGIGLALVQDLIRLHGGTVRATSEEGKGSSFTVTLRSGRTHLADAQIVATAAPIDPASRAGAYVAEAMQWIPASPAAPAAAALAAGAPRERIVWADDNADMRDYVSRLLDEHYAVTAVSNGLEAVAAALAAPPDLVLTDIMMPGLDGYGVLRELRADQRTRHIPVILLSARAGEEAVVDGLSEGADDYLVKPFAARELLSRVRTHLRLGKLRREWAAEQARAADLERDATQNRKLLAGAVESRRVLLGILEDQQRAEAAWRESEARIRSVFEQANDGIYIISAENRYLDANPRGLELLGHSRDELLQMTVADVLAPHEVARLAVEPPRMMSGIPHLAEWVHVRRDGSTFPGEVSARRLDEHSYLAIVRDLSERRRLEEERDRLFNFSLDMLCVAGFDGYFKQLNPAWTQTLGWTLDELKSGPWLDFVHAEDREVTLRAGEQLSRGQAMHGFENRYRCKDASYRWLSWNSYPMTETETIFAVVRDVTERKQADDALRKSELSYRTLIENAADAIFVLTADGRICQVNSCACEMFGYSAEEFIGMPASAIIAPADVAGQRETFRRVAAGERVSVDRSYRRKDGSVFPVEINACQTVGGLVLGIVRDVTERKQAEAEVRRLHEDLQRHAADLEQRVVERTVQLEAAKIRAEAADRAKSTFLATMSHELRTPLNSIIGFTGVLQQKLPGPLNAEQEKQLGIVRNAARHLLALISDVLDISKVEAGELSLAREPFDLRALLQRLAATFAPEARRRGLDYGQNIAEEELIVTGDARRVEQVLNNLISNALKFTPSGGSITLDCARRGDACIIAVSDTGVGVRAEDMQQLFRPFSQIDNGLTALREGTGLGLAISQHLAQAMGADIVAESEWGKGSRFTFTLPRGGKA